MPIAGKDYRGLKLCESCWNGQHWSIPYRGQPPRNLCQRGGCQCSCPEMAADRSGINRRLRAKKLRNQDAQAQFPYPGTGYSHTNPQDKRRG